MIADILHVGLTVRDIDASVDWYTRVLGMELVHRQRGDNAYTRKLVGVPDAVLEVAQLTIGARPSGFSTHLVELIQYVSGEVPGGFGALPNQVGTGHLAFIVTDIHTRYAAMRSTGVRFVNPPVHITEGANAGGFACYLRDPDGFIIELLQFAPERFVSLGLAIEEEYAP